MDKADILRLKRCDLAECEAACCYNGAYISPEEERLIKESVATYPDFFSFLPQEYIVEGNWLGKFSGRKTAVHPYQYKNSAYPAHFDQTRCVFAFNDGRCSLQALSIQLGEHRWARKPKACWKHPLREDPERENLMPPPINQSDDPDRIESYAGFASFTPCGTYHPDGKPWYETLKEELGYYKKYRKNKSAP